jgi:signal transduction histidine kinase
VIATQHAGWEAAFLFQVAHELRTPLTATRGALGLLANGAHRTPESQAMLVSMALRNADRLVRLVDDWVDLGALMSGCVAAPIVDIDPGALVRETVDGLQSEVLTRGVTLVVAVRSTRRLRGDRDRLARALRLAIEGAMAAASRDCVITAVVENDDECGVAFGVEATTFGISVRLLEEILVDATAPGRLARGIHEWPDGGHGGLCLPICAAIVTHLGGSIAVRRRDDRVVLRWTV